MTQAASDEDRDSKPLKMPHWLRPWILGGLGAFAAWGLFVAVAWHAFGLEHAWLGQWGDSFAPLTGIASTLALIMTTWSVSMQRRELELQREELRLTRREMRRQRLEMKAQRAAQEQSAAAQQSANRIANLANAIAVEQGVLAAFSMAAASNPGGGSAVQLLDVMKGYAAQKMPSDETGHGAALHAAAEIVEKLVELRDEVEDV